MVSTTKLPVTVSLVNVVCRYLHTGLFQQEVKQISHMSETSRKNLRFGNNNLKNITSCTESSSGYSTHCNNLLPQYKSEHSIFRNSCLDNKTKIMDSYMEQDTSDDGLNVPYTTDKNIVEPLSPNLFEEVKRDVNNLAEKFRYGISRAKYKELRPWKTVNDGTVNKNTDFIIRILSYNILAQNLLETHSYLYKDHHRQALNWDIRKLLVQKEIIEADANVICIQEMQMEHLQDFLLPFVKNNKYDYLYKKRTNNTKDGLLLLYKPKELKVEEYVYVEYHQTTADILNRDNVGIVVKFSLRERPNTFVVISTTHLLYNPKRNDVRLAQTQILFSELERIAFIDNKEQGPTYHPIILCGDFNLQPYTGVYKFITEGAFSYVGKGRTLDDTGFLRLSNSLIPSSLLVTDSCQHFNILTKRLRGVGSEKIMLNGSESFRRTNGKMTQDNKDDTNEVNTKSQDYQKIEIKSGQYAHFSSGALTHPFKLNSVYQHVNSNSEMEATTNQGEWITVDYIFYSQVELLNQYRLPTVSECEMLPSIPNFTVGSDHLCLGATFKLKIMR